MTAQQRDPYSGHNIDERFYVFNEKTQKQENESPGSDTIYDLTESILSDEEANAKNALSQLWDLKNRVESENAINTIETLIEHYQNKIDLMRSKEKRIRTISEDSRELLYEKMKSEKELKAVKAGILKCKAGIETLQAKLEELEAKESELSLFSHQIHTELSNNNSEVINGLYEVVLSRSETAATNTVRSEDANTIEDIPSFVRSPFEEFPPFPISKVTTKDGLIVSQYYMDKAQPETSRFIVHSNFFADKVERLLPSIHSKSVKTELILSIRDILKRTSEGNAYFEISLNEIINPHRLHDLERAVVSSDTYVIKEFSDKLRSKINALGDNHRTLLEEQMYR